MSRTPYFDKLTPYLSGRTTESGRKRRKTNVGQNVQPNPDPELPASAALAPVLSLAAWCTDVALEQYVFLEGQRKVNLLDHRKLKTALKLCEGVCPDPAVRAHVFALQNTKNVRDTNTGYGTVVDALLCVVRDAEAMSLDAHLDDQPGVQPGAQSGAQRCIGAVEGGTAEGGAIANNNGAMLTDHDEYDFAQSIEGGRGEQGGVRAAASAGPAPTDTMAAAAGASPDLVPSPPSPMSPPSTVLRPENDRKVLTRTPGSAGLQSEPTAMEMRGEMEAAATGVEDDDDEEGAAAAAVTVATTATTGSLDFGTVSDAYTAAGNAIYDEEDANAKQEDPEAAAAAAAATETPVATGFAVTLEPREGSADPAPATTDNDDEDSGSDGDEAFRMEERLTPPMISTDIRVNPAAPPEVLVAAEARATAAVSGDGNTESGSMQVAATAASAVVMVAGAAAVALVDMSDSDDSNNRDPPRLQQPPLSPAATTSDTTPTVTIAAAADVLVFDLIRSRSFQALAPPPPSFTPSPSAAPMELSPSTPAAEAEAEAGMPTQVQVAAAHEEDAMDEAEGEASGEETATRVEMEMEMETEVPAQAQLDLKLACTPAAITAIRDGQQGLKKFHGATRVLKVWLPCRSTR